MAEDTAGSVEAKEIREEARAFFEENWDPEITLGWISLASYWLFFYQWRPRSSGHDY